MATNANPATTTPATDATPEAEAKKPRNRDLVITLNNASANLQKALTVAQDKTVPVLTRLALLTEVSKRCDVDTWRKLVDEAEANKKAVDAIVAKFNDALAKVSDI